MDWSFYKISFPIESGLQHIYNSWTDSELISKWFTATCDYINPSNFVKEKYAQKGYEYVWTWHGSEYIMKGKILEANGKDFLKFSFAPGTVVAISLKQENENFILLELSEEIGINDEENRIKEYINSITAWTEAIAQLKAFLYGGLEIRFKG